MHRIILHAAEIPIGSTVTKKTGEKPYILRKELTIYGKMADVPQKIVAKDVFFMIDERGGINAIPHDQELMWHVNEHELYRWLDERRYGSHQ